MTDNFKKVWEQIEEGIGGCCLHKKAAYNEVSAGKVQQLTLVTTASKEAIESFLGDIEVERPQKNRFGFTYNGVQVDLTTYEEVEDLDELYEKSFRHTLTIDSLGVRRDGKVSNGYGGLEDIQTKTLRLTDATSTISEILFRRMLNLILTEGYHMDESVAKRIETDKLFEKESYRRRFSEILIGAVHGKAHNWDGVADLLETLGGTLGHQAVIIEYTRKIKKPFTDERFCRSFLYLIFALIKVTARELEELLPGDKMLVYFDSIVANLQKKVNTASMYRSMKEKYGMEFLELLFDVQQLWMAMENIPYKRPTERDFDRMNLIQSDDSRWVDPKKQTATKEKPPVVPNTESEESGKYRLEGTINFARAMDPNYNEEEYDEPMEGPEVDTYSESDESEDTGVQAPSFAEQSTRASGTLESGLDVMESEIRGEPITPNQTDGKPKKEGIMNHFKGHTGKMLGK